MDCRQRCHDFGGAFQGPIERAREGIVRYAKSGTLSLFAQFGLFPWIEARFDITRRTWHVNVGAEIQMSCGGRQTFNLPQELQVVSLRSTFIHTSLVSTVNILLYFYKTKPGRDLLIEYLFGSAPAATAPNYLLSYFHSLTELLGWTPSQEKHFWHVMIGTGSFQFIATKPTPTNAVINYYIYI